MSYRGKWTPGAFMWIGAEQEATAGQTINVPDRCAMALTGARNGLPEWHPYVWQAAGRAREITVTALLEEMKARVMAQLDAEIGPGAGVHAYRRCAGECGYCAVELAEEMQKLHVRGPSRGAFTRGARPFGARSAGASGAARCAQHGAPGVARS